MKLSEQLKQDHECGDFGRALAGYAERAEALEQEIAELRSPMPGPLYEVKQERMRQDAKWGQENDNRNTPLDWHETIADYNGWARRMLCMGSIDKGRRRLIQLAAVAIAEVEALDRLFPR